MARARTRARIVIKRPGALRRKTGTKKGSKIPVATLRRKARSRNLRTKRQAIFALNARKWSKKRR